MTDRKPQEIQEIEDILSELSGDFKVRIERLEPKWCDGSLGTLHISAGEKLDIEELGERFGGRRYLLRFIGPSGKVLKAKTIKFPGPPREDGIEIKQPNAIADNVPIVQQAPAPNPFELIAPFLNALTSQANANQKTVETLMMSRIASLENQINNQQPQQQPLQQISGLDQIRDSMNMIAEITTLQKQILPTEGSSPQEEKSPVENAIQDFMKMMMEREKNKMQLAVSQQAALSAPPPLDQPPVNLAVPPVPDPMTLLKNVPNEIFATEVKRRFQNLSEDDQIDLMRSVAGDSIEFEEDEPEKDQEPDLNSGAINDSGVNSKLGGPPILSEDDQTIKESSDAADPIDETNSILNHTQTTTRDD